MITLDVFHEMPQVTLPPMAATSSAIDGVSRSLPAVVFEQQQLPQPVLHSLALPFAPTVRRPRYMLHPVGQHGPLML